MTKKQKHYVIPDDDFNELGKYVRWVADQMGLRDWLLKIQYGPPENADGTPSLDAAAQCHVVYGKKVARFYFAASFYEEEPERQVCFVVHELLHCHFDHIDTLTTNQLRTHVGEIYYQAWNPAFEHAVEQCVNAIAEEWSRKFPKIEWPSLKKKKKRVKKPAK